MHQLAQMGLHWSGTTSNTSLTWPRTCQIILKMRFDTSKFQSRTIGPSPFSTTSRLPSPSLVSSLALGLIPKTRCSMLLLLSAVNAKWVGLLGWRCTATGTGMFTNTQVGIAYALHGLPRKYFDFGSEWPTSFWCSSKFRAGRRVLVLVEFWVWHIMIWLMTLIRN